MAFTGVAAAVLGTCWGLWYHGMDHLIGIDSQATQFYAFFSGFGTWVLALAGYSGLVITLLRALNCHEVSCWRIGRFPVAGGRYKVCGRHHGDITGHHPRHLTVQFLRAVHERHVHEATRQGP